MLLQNKTFLVLGFLATFSYIPSAHAIRAGIAAQRTISGSRDRLYSGNGGGTDRLNSGSGSTVSPVKAVVPRVMTSPAPVQQAVQHSQIPADPIRVSIPSDPHKTSIPTDPVRVAIPTDPVNVAIPTDPIRVAIPTDPIRVSAPSDSIGAVAPAEPVQYYIPSQPNGYYYADPVSPLRAPSSATTGGSTTSQ